MTESVTRPKRDDPEKPQPDPTVPDGDEETTSPMDWVGTGSVPTAESTDPKDD